MLPGLTSASGLFPVGLDTKLVRRRVAKYYPWLCILSTVKRVPDSEHVRGMSDGCLQAHLSSVHLSSTFGIVTHTNICQDFELGCGTSRYGTDVSYQASVNFAFTVPNDIIS